jgi:hypothetical protein
MAHSRYAEAPTDSPTTMTATLQFDTSPGQQAVREALADYLRFGTLVTIPTASIATVTVDTQPGGAASSRVGR